MRVVCLTQEYATSIGLTATAAHDIVPHLVYNAFAGTFIYPLKCETGHFLRRPVALQYL